jgi:hypothetical protein
VEARGGALIRGEILSWVQFVAFSASVTAPLLLGWVTAIEPLDARYMFLLCTGFSIVSAAILQRVLHLKLLPSQSASEEEGLHIESSGRYRAMQWGDTEEHGSVPYGSESLRTSSNGKNGRMNGASVLVNEGSDGGEPNEQMLRPKLA